MTSLFSFLAPILSVVIALAIWISAIPISYRIQAMKRPDHAKGRMTDMAESAFGAVPAGEAAFLQSRLRRRLMLVLVFGLGAGVVGLTMATLTSARQPSPSPVTAAAPVAVHTAGTTLHYVRSNQDGSMPERILVHIVSPTEVAVAKMVERCTDAALVTATFNAETGEATQLVGGRLERDGSQLPQAWLDLDASARRLDVRFGSPTSAPAETLPAPAAPWRMYDFDLAEFALRGHRAQDSFTFGLAMAWPDGPPPLVRALGDVTASFASTQAATPLPHNVYRVAGPAFGAGEGQLTLDATWGHVVEARFPIPNHPGYDNFLLKLDHIVQGEDIWRSDLAAHWKDCPA